MIMHIINAVGDTLDAGTARAMSENMLQNGILSKEAVDLIQAAVSEKALALVPRELRNYVRASVYKNMLIAARA